jgi:CRISPR/Cas system-associated exonuclease Cas4 (RecB family)
MACMWRAALDRAVYERLIVLAPEEAAAIQAKKASSPYADLGTVTHFTLQDGLRAKFFRGQPADYAPKPEQWTNAATLFRGDLDTCKRIVGRAAALAAVHLQGKPWLAEVGITMPMVTGHIDLLVEEAGGDIVDLKTTTRPPTEDWCKPEHLAQILVYAVGVERAVGVRPKRGVLLYLDAINAAWCHPRYIDLTAPDMVELADRILAYCEFLMGPHLYQVAVPNIGPACENWCPYTSICRDKIRAGVTGGPSPIVKPVTCKANPFT